MSTAHKMISKKIITDTTVELLKRAVTDLPGDVELALKNALLKEENEIARMQLDSILKNVKLARKKTIPMCQDTGIISFFVRIGCDAELEPDFGIIENAIREGVRIATQKIPLRPNAVHPITRENSGDNTGMGVPCIDIEILEGKHNKSIEITVLPKGAGSENMSSLKMLKPSEGVNGIKKFVIETVANAGGNPCPPTIIGVGVGGSSDYAMKLAKKALLRPLERVNGTKNNEDMISGHKSHEGEMKPGEEELANELFNEINRLGIGPMGLGGKTTCLGVNIEYAHSHTASLPVAVNIQCWANRRCTARIYDGGSGGLGIEFSNE